MKKMLCWLLGHQPRGPITPLKDSPVLYSCDRSKEIIIFDRDKGWLYYE
jgi:hypothetical protein